MITGKFRASYAHVFEAASTLGGEAKYSITMLIPKSDMTTINQIYAEIEKTKNEAIQSVFGGRIPPIINIPFYDGDGLRPTGEPFGEECRGHMVLRASSKTRPSVVDVNIQPILDPNEFYSGCYARATINFFAYDQRGNKGIGCGLNNLQKLGDGDPLSGRTTAAEDFGGSNSYSPMGGYQQPAAAPAQNYGQPMPGYSTVPQTMPMQVPQYGQPAYPQQPAQFQPQPAMGYPQQQPAVNPVNGQPMPGPVMGM